MSEFYKGVCIVESNNGAYLANKKGEIVVAADKYDSFYYMGHDLFNVSKNYMVGAIDLQGNEIIPLNYSYGGLFLENELTYFYDGERYYLIDYKGNIMKTEYTTINSFYGGLALVELNGLYGYINDKGIEAIPLQYEDASDFYYGIAEVQKNGKRGLINMKNEAVVPIIYDNLESRYLGSFEYYENPNWYKVKKDNKYGYILADGTIRIPIIYDYISEFDDDKPTAFARLNGKTGIIDKENNYIIRPEYDEIGIFRDGVTKACKDGKWGIIDTIGKPIINFKYEFINNFSESMAAIKLYNKWGFSDRNDNVVGEIIYDNVENFNEGYAAVQYKGKWGFINKEGEIVIPCIYDSVTNFNGGFCNTVAGKKKYKIEAGSLLKQNLILKYLF